VGALAVGATVSAIGDDATASSDVLAESRRQ
jgi:hypothetical protein